MKYARLAVAKAKENAAARDSTGTDIYDCETFDAEIHLFEKASQNGPAVVEMAIITNEVVKVVNQSDSDISTGDVVNIGQTIGGQWFVLQGGGGGGGGIIALTPAGGIPKRTPAPDNAAQKAQCDEYFVDTDNNDRLTPVDATGTEKVEIYNIWACDINGNVFITAKKVKGLWIADAEDYPF